MANKGKNQQTAPAATQAAPATATAAPAAAPAAPVAVAAPPTLPNVPAALVPSAPPKGLHAGKGGGQGRPAGALQHSTVAGPVAVAWALYASLYAQHGPALTRKVAVAAAQAAGVAYYTARTQYQLWRSALLAQAQPPAPGTQAPGTPGAASA